MRLTPYFGQFPVLQPWCPIEILCLPNRAGWEYIYMKASPSRKGSGGLNSLNQESRG
jgi:hypothetical protein